MASFTVGTAFVPVIGKCYEVSFGRITFRGQGGECIAKIKVEGPMTKNWIDLDTGEVLDAEIRGFVVQAFREIDCGSI